MRPLSPHTLLCREAYANGSATRVAAWRRRNVELDRPRRRASAAFAIAAVIGLFSVSCLRHRDSFAVVAGSHSAVVAKNHVGSAIPQSQLVANIRRQRSVSSRDAEPTATRDQWQMTLGVPKVAYRVPGAQNAEWVDIYNRLYRERIIFLSNEIDERLANQIIGVLLYLDAEDNNKPIYLYINSVGGSVISGLAIYDTMQHIKSPVVTINVGLAASMASYLLAAGEKGRRLALPHSRTMIHQAVGGAQGQAEDIRVEAEQILKIHDNLVSSYSRMTGQPKEKIRKDLLRENFMSAEEAKSYGLIDQVIKLQDTVSLSERAAREPAPTQPSR